MNQFLHGLALLRATLFYAGYIVWTVFWGSLSVLIAWMMPYRARFTFIVVWWTSGVRWWLRMTCGVRHRVLHPERIPEQACIVFSKHESTWETLFLQSLFAPQATLIKRELLVIPFFGWAFALLRPIAIDRKSPRKALRRLREMGTERLNDGIWVVMFPEGTRTQHGALERFQPGGAMLAASTGTQILLIAHNAGAFWPAHQFTKRAGTVTVLVGEPMATQGKSAKVINQEAEAAMAELMAALDRTLEIESEPALDSNARAAITPDRIR